MSSNVIFYFSGTGNCFDLARRIARHLGDTDVVSIRKTPAVTDARAYKRVGFVFPCYGGGVPEDVLKQAKGIDLSPYAYTFAVSQSASYAGVGLSDLDKLVRLDYWTTTHHHCSCIWLFPHTMMVPPVSVEKAQELQEKNAARIAADVLAGKRSEGRPGRNVLNAAENKAWSLIAAKKAAQFKVSGACIGCGTCERLCPRENIRIVNGRAQIGTNCVQCLGCLQFCPQKAISIGSITDRREHYHNPAVSAADLQKPIIHID